MSDTTLENTIGNPAQNKNGLVGIINSFAKGMYQAASGLALKAGTLAFTLSSYGIGPAITSAGFMAGEVAVKKKKKEKITGNDMKVQYYMGQILGSSLYYFFGGVALFKTLVSKAAYVLGGTIPAFNAISLYAEPLVRKYSPLRFARDFQEKGSKVFSESYSGLKKNFIPRMKSVYTKPVPGLYVGGVLLNNLSSFPLPIKYGNAAALSFMYRIAQ